MAVEKQKITFSKNLKRMDLFWTYGRPLSLSDVDSVVVHWTGDGSIKSHIDYLWSNARPNGYHFMIDEDGSIVQLQKLKRKTNHAGVSYGPDGFFLNDNSFSISLVNVSDKTPPRKAQMDSLVTLIADLSVILKDNGGELKWVTTHFDIGGFSDAGSRKPDPYNLDMKKIISGVNTLLPNLNIMYYETGMSPFPKGLSGCKCEEWAEIRQGSRVEKICVKSSGNCNGTASQGTNAWRWKPELRTKTLNNLKNNGLSDASPKRDDETSESATNNRG